jgi:glycosyltransferase involved in cell wall biosynthesis
VSGPRVLVALADLRGVADPAESTATLGVAIGAARLVAGIALVDDTSPADVAAGWVSTTSFAAAAEQAFAAASMARAPLLVVLGAVRLDATTVDRLAAAIDEDPMFGVAHARATNAEGWVLPPLARHRALGPLPPESRQAMPAWTFVSDHASACMLVPARLTGNLQPRTAGWLSLEGVLVDFAVRARRLGFRAVLANDARVACDGVEAAERLAHRDDRRRLEEAFPCLPAVADRLGRHADLVDEGTQAAVFSAPDSLLIDARNLGPTLNGTTKAVVSLTSALYARRSGSRTCLWVSPAAERVHGLAACYPEWQICTKDTPPRRFAAAVRLSQPWETNEVLSMHEAAAVNVYLMLDTIAWDIAYAAPRDLDTVWRVVAMAADGLAFISEFSRQRFMRRFAAGPGVDTEVVHLSMAADDYVAPERQLPAAGPPFWLVLGNAYDHKHVAPTVDVLARAFPTREMVVLGDRDAPRGRRIRQLPGGSTAEALLQGVYAAADAVIYPSFYEGFGLPVLNALAYGRTVLARESALMHELAARYVGPGRLLLFEDEATLVDLLTRLVHGLAVTPVPFAPEGTPAHGWDQAAATLDAFIARLVARGPAGEARRLRTTIASLLRE